MSTRIDPRARWCGIAPCVLQVGLALAQVPNAPAHPLDEPAALKAAFASRIGRSAELVEFRLGEHHASLLVQQGADFDRYEALPGQPMPAGEPVKAAAVDCRGRLAFAALDAATGARLLRQARAIAAANGYDPPGTITLGAGMMCEAMGWRVVLTGAGNLEAQLHLFWPPDGSRGKAREFSADAWHTRDIARLLEGAAPAAPAAPAAAPVELAGDGRTRDFLRDIAGDLARLQAQLGAELAFKRIGFDAQQLSVDLLQDARAKRVSTWLVDREGKLRLWREADAIAFDCNRPFTRADFPFTQLPTLIAAAPGLIEAMPGAVVKDVAIRRSGLCGKPHVYVQVEDARGYGNVEYDQRGRLVSARVQ